MLLIKCTLFQLSFVLFYLVQKIDLILFMFFSIIFFFLPNYLCLFDFISNSNNRSRKKRYVQKVSIDAMNINTI